MTTSGSSSSIISGSLPSTSATSNLSRQEWDSLRKDARKLEGELDVKLASFAQLCATYRPGSQSAASQSPGQPSPEQVLRTRSAEIEASLQRLSEVNERLRGAIGSGDGRGHMVARHRDILGEFAAEARRLSATVGAARDRAELLLGGKAGEQTPLLGVQVQGSAGALLRERTAIQSSSTAMDDVIGQADAVSRNLKEQRQVFEGIGDKLMNLGSKFPVVNGLLKAISRKKSRDTIVLASVIAACMLFLIVYIMWR